MLPEIITLEDIKFRSDRNILDWYNISYHQIISEDIIRQFQDDVNWAGVSYAQKLSEDFIIEFQDRVYWNVISWSQKLSIEFILNNLNKLDIANVLMNGNLDQETREYLRLLRS